MNAPWLFAEAYKYRRLHECFSVSKFWRDYDVFYRQKVIPWLISGAIQLTSPIKCDTFSRSSDAVFELSMRFAEPFKIAENLPADERIESERLMFLELSQGLFLLNSAWRENLTCLQYACGATPPISHFSST